MITNIVLHKEPFVVTGCGGTDRIETFCKKLSSCNLLEHSVCVKEYREYIVAPEACLSMVPKMTCAQLEDTSQTNDLCAPPCTGSIQRCEGNQIIICNEQSNMLTFRYRCKGLCARYPGSGPGTWSGVCGKTSPTGNVSEVDRCWCD